MPLHTDNRPSTFNDFIGSASTVKSLKAKLSKKDHPHVYLITGPSGCGKTTLGRIIAREVGAIGKKELPDNAMNYKEMDSADFRGIDSIREIRRNVKLSPIGGGSARLWLLDECHQLTKDAQEALLKALEEAKGHVYFVLATTNPEKLKTTLKRRCSHYKVDPVEPDDMWDFLAGVAENQKADVEEDVIDGIVDACDGSPGIALSILDRVIDLEPEDAMTQLKSDPAQKEIIDLCRSLMNRAKWPKIAKLLKDLLQTQDPESIRRAVLGYASSILLKKDDPKAYMIMDAFRDPFYDTPKEKLILSAYESLYAEE